MTIGISALYWAEQDSKVYIGKSIDINSRFTHHCNKLKAGTHVNSKLLHMFDKYGLPILSYVEIYDKISDEELLNVEVQWILEFNSYSNGYNMTPGGDSGPVYKGIYNANCVTSEENLIKVFNDLCYTDDTQKEISKKYSVSIGIVERIAQGTGHKWLQDRFPEQYNVLLSIDREYKRSLSKNISKTIYPSLVSPNGVVYSNITNLSKFAKEHSLQPGNLHKMFNGARSAHKGWKLST